MKAESNLEKVLSAGHFAVTAELGPPMSADAEGIRKKAKELHGCAGAFNITDCQTAVVRMSSISSAVILVQSGMEPVMQMTCRDRNRIAIQADLLGAAAHGIKNCLCLSGDHQSFSASGKLKGHPGAKNVFDVDSIQLLTILRDMRDKGVFQGGDALSGEPPRFFIGAAWTPMAEPVDFRVIRLGKKIEAGADFIQTQAIYDVEQFAGMMEKVRARGLHERTCILGGVIVPKSAGMLRYMNSSVPGVVVRKALIDRMKSAENAKEEGKQIAVELIEHLRNIEGVKGVHVQAIEWESVVPDIVRRAGLLPRPKV